MADWQTRIDMSDSWDFFEGPKCSKGEFLTRLADRMEKLSSPHWDDEIAELRDELVQRLKDEAESELDDEEFEALLDEVYDWADTPCGNNVPSFALRKKVCWIALT